MKEKIKVLADFLKIKASEIEQVTWRDNCFEHWMVNIWC